ncbi:MAG: protein kinase [Candidatus Saganbacteria bacterium]|nr:protein kinase [Candidatus Saganbacteria bacterium]
MPQPLPPVRHNIIARIDRWALNRPGWQKFGKALKYIAPLVTAAIFPALYMLGDGVQTITGLLVYLAAGAATGTLGSRSVSRSFREASLMRNASENLQELERDLIHLKRQVETGSTEKAELISRISELQRQKGKLIEGLQGAYGENINIEQMLGLDERAFDGHNIFKQVLGMGGMAVAVLIHNIDMDAEKVFKIPRPDLLGNPMNLARFKGGEARSMLELNHPNVVRFFTLNYMTRENYLELLRLSKMSEYETLKDQPDLIPEQVPYIEMEYVKGETLATRMVNEPFTPRTAVHLGIIIAETLWHVHHKGIIHRDLKPENIFVIDDEYNAGHSTIKIGDFGLAKVVENGTRSPSMQLTQIGEIFGTPQYMSPEQWRGQKVGWESDQYALGVMLFEMITGRLPFGRTEDIVNNNDVYNYGGQVMTHDPPRLSEFTPVPPKLDTVILRMTARDIDKRFSSWKDCVDALRAAFEEAPLPQDATAIAELDEDGVPKRRN